VFSSCFVADLRWGICVDMQLALVFHWALTN